MKKIRWDMMLMGGLGAVIAYTAVDGFQYILSRNRGEVKKTGVFRFDPLRALGPAEEVEIDDVDIIGVEE